MALSEWEILDGLAEILNEEARIPLGLVHLRTGFCSDLGIESATMRTIAQEIEQKFHVSFVGRDFPTVGDAVAYIQAAQG